MTSIDYFAFALRKLLRDAGLEFYPWGARWKMQDFASEPDDLSWTLVIKHLYSPTSGWFIAKGNLDTFSPATINYCSQAPLFRHQIGHWSVLRCPAAIYSEAFFVLQSFYASIIHYWTEKATVQGFTSVR